MSATFTRSVGVVPEVGPAVIAVDTIDPPRPSYFFAEPVLPCFAVYLRSGVWV